MKIENKKRIALVISIVCAVVFLLSVGVLAATFVSATTERIKVEVGETPEPEKIHDSEFLSSLYNVEPYQIDVSEPGEHHIGLKFFGFLPGEVTVEVCDTTPPVLELQNVHTVTGTEITAADFLRSCSDATAVTASFNTAITTDAAGEYPVEITVSDAKGNAAIGHTMLKVYEADAIIEAELNAADIENAFLTACPDITEIDMSDIPTGTAGEYILRGLSENTLYIWPVRVSDTTPPTVLTNDRAIRPGEILNPDNFVESVEDASAYTVSFAQSIDFTVPGLHEIVLVIEDAYGNRTEPTVKLLIVDIPTEILLEYGVSTSQVGAALLGNTEDREMYALSDCPTEIGIYDLTASTQYGSYIIRLEISDTTAPNLILKETTVFTGDSVGPEYFVLSAEDAAEVIYRFDGPEPVSDTPGEYTIKIIASDPSGNQSSAETVYYVADDTTPPVIYGAVDKQILVGETVSFKKGVYAVDNRDGDVAFKVDSSAVNTTEEGIYPITYTSIDAAGNEASITVYLKVKVNNMDAVNELADGILAQIITAGMTEREKAWAIYSWITASLKYSTRTSYLMGNYTEGAYSGLTIRSGNCYIYYAVSGALLTRAGIENIMIQRDKPDNPHYWNMVKIDGDWYHFDTCPQYSGHKMQCFLKTDKELAAYNEYEVADYYSFDATLYPETP
ncbi:MAG: hypothetical protein E7658_05525 [Ruminococcaceae bacterium]|nr:hypothetical protein [Oscillospiraceae bacterium]